MEQDNLITVMVNDGQSVYHGVIGNRAEGGDIISLEPQDAYDLSNARVVQILDQNEASRLKARIKKAPSALQELEKENMALKAIIKNETTKRDLEKEHEDLKNRFAQLEKMLTEKYTQDSSEVKEEVIVTEEATEDTESISDLDEFMKKKEKVKK